MGAKDIKNIILNGQGIKISEDDSNPDYLKAKFCVCDFGVNHNNVRLNRDTISDWVETLVGTPLVAKIAKNFNGEDDFTSHNFKVVITKDDDGNTVKQAIFDTNAFGVCTDVSIETAEDDKEYIYANYKIWKRFDNACKIVQERCDNLHTSWEISVTNSTDEIKNGEFVTTINEGRFIGLAMLGNDVLPAYDSSGLLSVASATDNELNTALIEDLKKLEVSSDININDKEVAEMKDDTQKDIITSEGVTEVDDTQVSADDKVDDEVVVDANANTEDNTNTEINDAQADVNSTKNAEADNNVDDTQLSALTTRDLVHKIEKAYYDYNSENDYGSVIMVFPEEHKAWFKEWDSDLETDLVEVEYVVEDDKVKVVKTTKVTLVVSPREINQVVAQKDSAIVEMSNQIQSLNNTIKELEPYKTKVDEIEKAEREAQQAKERQDLIDYAISSNYITKEEIETSEEIIGFINNLDKASIKAMIADRVVASLSQNTKKVEVANAEKTDDDELKVQINLSSASSKNSNDTAVEYKSIMKQYLEK